MNQQSLFHENVNAKEGCAENGIAKELILEEGDSHLEALEQSTPGRRVIVLAISGPGVQPAKPVGEKEEDNGADQSQANAAQHEFPAREFYPAQQQTELRENEEDSIDHQPTCD